MILATVILTWADTLRKGTANDKRFFWRKIVLRLARQKYCGAWAGRGGSRLKVFAVAFFVCLQ